MGGEAESLGGDQVMQPPGMFRGLDSAARQCMVHDENADRDETSMLCYPWREGEGGSCTEGT